MAATAAAAAAPTGAGAIGYIDMDDPRRQTIIYPRFLAGE